MNNENRIAAYDISLDEVVRAGGYYDRFGIWNSIVKIDGRLLRGRVEVFIFKDDKIFAADAKNGLLRVPGGSFTKGISNEHQCYLEAKEEARLLIKNIEYSGYHYIRIYDKIYTSHEKNFIPCEGTYNEVYIAEYDSQYNGFIKPIDADNNMYKTGKWYSIEELYVKLPPNQQKFLEMKFPDKVSNLPKKSEVVKEEVADSIDITTVENKDNHAKMLAIELLRKTIATLDAYKNSRLLIEYYSVKDKITNDDLYIGSYSFTTDNEYDILREFLSTVNKELADKIDYFIPIPEYSSKSGLLRVSKMDDMGYYDLLKNENTLFPYYLPNEMEKIGVFNQGHNFYAESVMDDESIKIMMNYKENVFTGVDQNWYDILMVRYNEYEKDPTDYNRQRLLDLGWNPEIAVTPENIAKVSNNTKKRLASNKCIDITNIIKGEENMLEYCNLILNGKDLEINLDKFESGEENVLLITGLSGSGKSTLAEKLSSKYKCTYYELDCLTFYMKGLLTKEDAIGGEEGLLAFIESKNLKPDKNISYKTGASLYREYIEFLINWCKRQKNKKFIIEGLQIYEVYEDGDTFITSCPIIIKGTSGLVSSIRAAKRNDGSFFKEFGPLIKWVLQDVKHIEKLKKAVSESYIAEATKSNYKFIGIRKSNEIDDFYSALKEVFGEDDEDGISREDVRKYGKRIKFNNTYIGYICIIDDIYENNKKYIGICNFIILPKYQRKGHGANVIHDLVEQNKSKFDEIYCWVETNNTDAIRFYKRIGDVYDDVKPRTTKSGGSVYYVCLYKKPENVSESYDESYVEEGALRQTFMSIPIKTLNMKNKTPINSMTDLMKYHKNPGLELYAKKCKDIDDLKYLQKDLRYTIPSIQKAKERIALCRKLGECSTTKSYYKGIKKMYLDQGITEKDCDLTIKGLNGTQKVISDRIKELKSANESYIEESNVKYNFKSNPMYFLSGVSMNDELLTPRIPSNYFTKNGYEDNKTPRVCFASSIDKALMGLSQNLKGKMFYVHVPEKGQYLEIYKPSLNEVPDSKITGEIWVKNPVNVKCIGKILVISDDGKDGHKFKYGDNESELYGWNWNWEWNEQESTSLELALYLKDEVRKHLLESTNNEYYRVTYHGIGIYEALRNNVSNEEWRVILNNSQSIKWLPKPPNYNFNNRSYFTKLGYNTFNKKTLPLIRKYLNPNDIKTEIYNTLDGSIVYIDKYQIVVDVSNLHTDQDTISNRDKALEMKTFYEGYASDEVILQEMKRSILPDEVFGIPELRKYPMPDRKHVLSAIRFFNHVDYKYERQLAKRIIINMKKYNIDGSHVGKDNRLRKYLPKDMKESAVCENYLISRDDIRLNFDLWKKNSQNNILYVTGLSGSGKSTLGKKLAKEYNAEYIEFDMFTLVLVKGLDVWRAKANTPSSNIKPHPLVVEYVDQNNFTQPATNSWGPALLTEYNFDEHNKFIKWLNNRVSGDGKLYILEGAQLFMNFTEKDYSLFAGKPLIVTGTSMMKSWVRRFSRDVGDDKTPKNYIKYLKKEFPVLKYYFENEKKLGDFVKSISNYYIDESAINENNDYIHEDFLSQNSKPVKNQRVHVKYLKNKRKRHINNKPTSVNTLPGDQNANPVATFSFQNASALLQDDLFNYLIESENTKERKRPIFIVTSWTNTLAGKIIAKWTRSTFTHAAVGFDTALDKLYSFNADNKINKFGGFSVESIQNYREIYEDAKICVSVFFVKESDFDKIKQGVDKLESSLKRTTYDFKNILNILFNRAVEIGAKGEEVLSLVCSEFVAWLISLADINLVNKPINLIIPKDLSSFNNPKIYKLYEGFVVDYDKTKIDRVFKKLKKTANVIKESMIIEYMEMKKK